MISLQIQSFYIIFTHIYVLEAICEIVDNAIQYSIKSKSTKIDIVINDTV